MVFKQYNDGFVANPTASHRNVSEYPDIEPTMHNVTLIVTCQVTSRMELILQAMHSYYHDNNWNGTANAIQGAGPTAIAILVPAYSSTNDSGGLIVTGVRIKLSDVYPPFSRG